MKKYGLLLMLLSSGGAAVAQVRASSAIDSSNYYAHLYDVGKTELTLNWLRLEQVVPVVVAEMKKAGYHDLVMNYPYKVAPDKYVTLAVYSKAADVGFLYIDGHNADPVLKHRRHLRQRIAKGQEVVPFRKQPTGPTAGNKPGLLPANILLLSENCYWYQYRFEPEEEEAKLVTRKIAFNTLNQDIRRELGQVAHFKQRQGTKAR